jgi:hypothetical protein
LMSFVCEYLLDFFGERIDFDSIFATILLIILWSRIILPSLIAFLVPAYLFYRYSKKRSYSLICSLTAGIISIIFLFTV